jgi:Domain of Unknown Function (DUF349)
MTDNTQFGRVADDGTVFVRTGDGERAVGQWPGGDPEAALAFYRTRFEGLEAEVGLLEQRIKARAVSPEDAASALGRVRGTVAEAQAVGDLEGLTRRLDALQPLINLRREERKAEKAAKLKTAKASKEKVVADAEKLAQGSDWRNGVTRLRELLQAWKDLPRLDKPSDDALWHRFSAARTTYTRRRKQHFGELVQKRDAAKAVKEKLVAEAEELSSSTDWAATARAYRDLMTRWKAAGSAQRDDDDALWKRFRTAQDVFFSARTAVNAELDTEYAKAAATKRSLLEEAEKLLPIGDLRAAKEAFRSIADRWDAAGKVPRADVKDLENRFKRVEQAVRGAEDISWRRSNPEAQSRARETVAKLEAMLTSLRADLAKAEASGDERAAAGLRESIVARESWRQEAAKALQEFGGA